jgi:hypothetical protein
VAFQETHFFALAMDIADARIAASMSHHDGISNLGARSATAWRPRLSDNRGSRGLLGIGRHQPGDAAGTVGVIQEGAGDCETIGNGNL